MAELWFLVSGPDAFRPVDRSLLARGKLDIHCVFGRIIIH